MSAHECTQADAIKEIQGNVSTINKTLYFGNGHPSLVTEIATIKQMLRGLCWLTALMLGTTLGGVLSKVLQTAGVTQ